MKKHEYFFKTAILLGEKSKCVSKKVGAVIVKSGRIISTGYNGTPSGYINCCEKFDPDNFDRESHHIWSNINEIHAEMNALLFAAKNGLSVDESSIYCTLQPCYNCLKNLVASGIKKIYYLRKYDKAVIDQDLLDFINEKGIKLKHVTSKKLEEFQDYIDEF